MPKGRGAYPTDWAAIARRTKDEAGWRCVRCAHPHDRAAGRVLTVHHLSMDKSDCRWWNLLALCQRCHLRIQGKVVLERPWVWEHTAWFRPYVAGWYAWRYLGEDLDRVAALERLDELLDLERKAVLGAPR